MPPARTAEPDAEVLPQEAGAPFFDLAECLSTGAMFYGTAVKEIRITLADGRTQRLQLPTYQTVDCSEGEVLKLAGEILGVLGTLQPREWMGASAVASQIDPMLDHKSGTWTRAVRYLRDAKGNIESHKQHGYRLKPRG